MNAQIQELSQPDRLIHEPARLMIMMILKGAGEADFLCLQREGEFTQGNLSSHLSKLEEAGYVEIEKKFKGKLPLTVCRLTPNGEAGLSSYSQTIVRALQSNQNLKRKGSRGPSRPDLGRRNLFWKTDRRCSMSP